MGCETVRPVWCGGAEHVGAGQGHGEGHGEGPPPAVPLGQQLRPRIGSGRAPQRRGEAAWVLTLSRRHEYSWRRSLSAPARALIVASAPSGRSQINTPGMD